ncbi:MAG: DUF1559 domain-containing protein [Planctomycetaceae bacterium]|nr:DUF1559 domain-containing protein [Planctomycetaceae bacterium]
MPVIQTSKEQCSTAVTAADISGVSYRPGRNWNNNAQIGTAFNTILPPSSYHSGGVNVALGDGSVRFI